MDDAYLLCQRHAGDSIIDALLYRLGLVTLKKLHQYFSVFTLCHFSFALQHIYFPNY